MRWLRFALQILITLKKSSALLVSFSKIMSPLISELESKEETETETETETLADPFHALWLGAT